MSRRFRDRLGAAGEPIRIAIIGIGSMGKGLAHQARITPGLLCNGLADRDLSRAVACATFLGREHRMVETADQVSDAIRGGLLPVCEDGRLLAACQDIDVLVESSSDIAAGGQHAETAISAGHHVVMMNAEADLIFGPYLMALADTAGVVYSSTDGDQPGVIAHLVDEIERWGFELIMAGNMKGFLDRYSDPTKIMPEARRRNFDDKMAAGYTDGTKLCIEMALVANAFGLAATTTGMIGPRVGHVREVLEVFDFEAIRRTGPVVDYVLGAQPDGGVFVVGHCDHPYQRSMLKMLKMGDGPFYVFYRPYHLCHVEAMAAVLLAAEGRAVMQPRHGFRTNVYAYAKADLPAGRRLDGFGGYTCYGLIENCDFLASPPGLPLCLTEGLVLARDVRKDQRLTFADINHDPDSPPLAMFAKALDASSRLS